MPIINVLNKLSNFFKTVIEAIQNSRMEKAKKIAEEYKTRYNLDKN